MKMSRIKKIFVLLYVVSFVLIVTGCSGGMNPKPEEGEMVSGSASAST